MDKSTVQAFEAIAKTQAGIIVAIATFAEALIKENVIDADRLILHLENPSAGLLASGIGAAEMVALHSVIAFVNTPPPKGGGFRLRLEAGLIDPSGR